MSVYFAQARADQSSVKIGFTSDLAARKKNLAVSSPGGVTILAVVNGGKETESYLHERFEEYRISGEWFRYEDALRDFVRDAQNGKPGLIPFRENAEYMRRSTSQFSTDAVEAARQMALALINREFRGIGDTADAARYRVEAKTGVPYSWLHRLQYRQLKDIPAGVYLHLIDACGPDAALVRLADAVAGRKETEGKVK